MPRITLHEITRDNLREATRLKVAPGQESFVASNAYSVAQSKFYPTWVPLAIHNGETMVGFLMYGRDEEGDQGYWLIRLMFDVRYQQRGYGRAAMLEVLPRMRSQPGCGDIFLSYEPNNEVAAKFYRELGFEETGRVEGGEIVVRLPAGRGVPTGGSQDEEQADRTSANS